MKFYGFNVDVLFDLVKKYKEEVKEYNMLFDVLILFVYVMDYEMIVKLVDFFVCCRGVVFFNIYWVYEWKEVVINYMVVKLGWSKEE